jgi:hypothetical protein
MGKSGTRPCGQIASWDSVAESSQLNGRYKGRAVPLQAGRWRAAMPSAKTQKSRAEPGFFQEFVSTT